MNAKPHRTNSDFQLRYFLARSCHTPDGARALMYTISASKITPYTV
jgi:hypothetical protein